VEVDDEGRAGAAPQAFQVVEGRRGMLRRLCAEHAARPYAIAIRVYSDGAILHI